MYAPGALRAIALGGALVSLVQPAEASQPALLAFALPASANAVAYRHYVACGISENARPAHSCPKKSKKGAFFKSLNANVSYSICVKFPTGKSICAKARVTMMK